MVVHLWGGRDYGVENVHENAVWSSLLRFVDKRALNMDYVNTNASAHRFRRLRELAPSLTALAFTNTQGSFQLLRTSRSSK
jgi:hypothetical protein